MGLKDLIKEAQAQKVSTQTTRVYMDLSADANAALEQLAAATQKSKKAMLEFLVNNAHEEFKAMEKETNKRAKKV
jgi:hypothetical protein